MPAGQERNNGCQQVASQWANTDLGAAIKWVQSLPDGPAKEQALYGIANPWVASDPKAAIAFMLGQPSSNQQSNLLYSAANQWAQKDPDAMRIWALSVPVGEFRLNVLPEAFSAWASSDPESAAAYVTKLSSDEQDAAGSGVLSTWGEQDPSAAAAWVSHLPDVNGRTNLFSQLAGVWASNDIDGAVRWLNTLPAGALYDQSAQAVVQQLAQTDPVATVKLVDSIQDTNIWQDAAEELANLWSGIDSNAAKGWVTQSALPLEFKTNFLNQAPVGGVQ
jgi:hypothetical protein